jgi:hypothetical protein
MAAIRGGKKFELRLAQLAANASKPGTLRVGFLEGATYPDGKSVALIAAIHNYGKWPFFTDMVTQKSPGWGDAVADLLKANDYDAQKTLGQAGFGIKGQLQQQIKDTVSPPNAPETVRRKGFDKPLIETGHLWNTVDFEVKT